MRWPEGCYRRAGGVACWSTDAKKDFRLLSATTNQSGHYPVGTPPLAETSRLCLCRLFAPSARFPDDAGDGAVMVRWSGLPRAHMETGTSRGPEASRRGESASQRQEMPTFSVQLGRPHRRGARDSSVDTETITRKLAESNGCSKVPCSRVSDPLSIPNVLEYLRGARRWVPMSVTRNRTLMRRTPP